MAPRRRRSSRSPAVCFAPADRVSIFKPAVYSDVHAAARTGQLSTLLLGDLDWIVMRCLEKDRTRRYETANAVALDVLRHLHDEPVVARPPSTAYRLQKLARRNKLAVGAALAIAASLVVGLGAATVMYLKEKVAREQAIAAEAVQSKLRAEADVARQTETALREQAQVSQRTAETAAARSAEVARFMEQMLTAVQPSVALGRDTTLLRDILEDTTRRIGRDLANQPEVELSLRSILGRIYRALKDYPRASANFEAALVLRRKLSAPDAPELADALEECGEALISEGMARLSAGRQGRLEAAQLLLREAVSIRRKNEPSPGVGSALFRLAGCLVRLGRFDEIDALCREGIDRAAQSSPRLMPHVLNAYALILVDANRPDEAEKVFRDALGSARAPATRDFSAERTVIFNFAGLLERQNKLAEAEKLRREDLELELIRLGPSHPSLVSPLEALADVLRKLGDSDEPAALLKMAATLKENAPVIDRPGGPAPTSAALPSPATMDETRAADLAAVASARAQQAIRNEARRLFNEGGALVRVGQKADAETAYRASIATWRRLQKRDVFAEASTLTNLAQLLRSSKPEEVMTLYREAIALQRGHGEGNSIHIAVDLINFSGILSELKQPEEAIAVAREAVTAYRGSIAGNAKNLGIFPSYLENLAQKLSAQKQFAEAESVLREALALQEEMRADDPATRLASAALGGVLLLANKVDEGEPLLVRAVENLFEQRSGLSRIQLIRLQTPLGQLVDFYKKVGRADDATLWQERLKEVTRSVSSTSAGVQARVSGSAITAQQRESAEAARFAREGDQAKGRGELAQAVTAYAEATRLDPSLARVWNEFAWLRATAPVARVRDGTAAIAAARKACELTSWNNPTYLDTLAAAYAEAGEFERAVEFQQKALALTLPNEAERPRWVARLTLYRDRKPYHQPELRSSAGSK